MLPINQKSTPQLKILNQYIKDLSYENPQSLDLIQSAVKTSDISVNLEAFFQSYDKYCISVTLKIICSSAFKKQRLFHLELDYYGYFKIIDDLNFNEDVLINEGVRLLFPFARSIISNISQNGGSVPIFLDNVDFNSLKQVS